MENKRTEAKMNTQNPVVVKLSQDDTEYQGYGFWICDAEKVGIPLDDDHTPASIEVSGLGMMPTMTMVPHAGSVGGDNVVYFNAKHRASLVVKFNPYRPGSIDWSLRNALNAAVKSK